MEKSLERINPEILLWRKRLKVEAKTSSKFAEAFALNQMNGESNLGVPKVNSQPMNSNFKLTPPFPLCSYRSKKEDKEKKILEVFIKIEINIPLLDAIKQSFSRSYALTKENSTSCLGPLKEMGVIIQLSDHVIVYPLGVLEDVCVWMLLPLRCNNLSGSDKYNVAISQSFDSTCTKGEVAIDVVLVDAIMALQALQTVPYKHGSQGRNIEVARCGVIYLILDIKWMLKVSGEYVLIIAS
ncbi:hypothetical protein O6P43_017121 [Quillaja saponaria]|uniref:Uncharacterized protein n=1 Tax=Quillaja saponaria TaxID=32244 RepID=A0AAD7LPI1_QUISA|nr:hypothetical protein O6P43_017121 [Quillaja saponaria]